MGLLRRLKNLLRGDELDSEIDEELRAHLELSADDGERAGLSRAEARVAAHRRFGNLVDIHERTADANSVALLDGIARDFRRGFVQLTRSRAFSAAVIATLALGIGGTTAIFTLVQQVLLRQLAVARPEELWRVGDEVRCCYARGFAQQRWSFFSHDAYEYFRNNTRDFTSLAAFQVGQVELAVRPASGSSPAQPQLGEFVSGNFFETFGISALRGRVLDSTDDRPGAPPVAVLSHHAWSEKYGASASAIGAAYVINGRAFTVIGVTPPDFVGAKIASSAMPDVWLPLSVEPMLVGATSRLHNPAVGWLDVIGRTRPGTVQSRLEAQLQGELRTWLSLHRDLMTAREASQLDRQTLRLTPGGAGVSLMRDQYARGIQLLFLAALCVLLVACTNVATLMLVRGLRDRRITALRAAIGASRARLIREVFARCLTLSLIGGACGIAVAYFGARLILRLAFTSSDAWIPVDARPSPLVLYFALGLALATSILFGIAPALLASRADPAELLRGGARRFGRQTQWMNRALVVAQLAISVVLVCVAAALGRGLRNLERQDFGFDPHHRYLISIDSKISNRRAEDMPALMHELSARLQQIPGVERAAPALYAPLSGYHWDHAVRVEGSPEPERSDDAMSAWSRVTPGFFETIGDQILIGRTISEADDAGARRVAVVNQAFATHFFVNANPIGRHFGPAPRGNSATYEVIGVAADIRYSAGERGDPRPMYFVPEAQHSTFDDAELQAREVWSHFPYSIVILAPHKLTNLEADVRRTVAAIDPSIVVYNVHSYDDVIATSFAQQHMIATLASLFGAISLLLAALGLYGITAYGVEERTSEIGIRMALGATQRAVVRLVLVAAVVEAFVGMSIGIPLSVAAERILGRTSFDVAPWDALLVVSAIACFTSVAIVAGGLPAWRAARVSPMTALRAE